MGAVFFNAVRRSLFDGNLTQEQVETLNAIVEAWERYGEGDLRQRLNQRRRL
jgi:hypothetical protein